MLTPDENRSLAGNLRWGLRWGMFAAALFTGMAALPALLRFVTRTTEVDGHPTPPFVHLVAVYCVAGLSAGIVGGVMRPLLRWWIGRRVVAMLALVPASFAVHWAMYPNAAWDAQDMNNVLGFAAVYGFMLSFAIGDWPFGPNPRNGL